MPSILLVEDAPDLRELLAQFLRDEGYDVLDVADATSGREALRRQPFDLVVTDLALAEVAVPDRESLGWVREAGATAPVVVITGWAGTGRVDLSQVGATAILPKPFDLYGLLSVVRGVAGPAGY